MSDTKLELDGFLPYQLNLLAHVVSQGLSTIYAERYGFGIPNGGSLPLSASSRP